MKNSGNLTQSQQLMWLGQQVDPDLPLYNMVLTFSLHGAIRPQLFEKAFSALIASTDAMRIIINTEDGKPLQQFVKTLDWHLDFFDFSSTATPEKTCSEWIRKRSLLTFDLSKSLFDSVLIKQDENHYIWYLNVHHLITDGWSSTIIYRRMSDLYQLALENSLHLHPSYPSYQDYIAYENEVKTSSEFANSLAYWQDIIADPLEPTTFYDSAVESKTARTARHSYSMTPDHIKAFNSLASQSGVRSINDDLTKFSLFTAILLSLIHRLSGQCRHRIGTPFHNRSTNAFKETSGLFIQVGVLQVELQPHESFLSLVRQVQSKILSGIRHALPGCSSAAMNSAYDVLINYIHADYGAFVGIPMESDWIHTGYGDRHHNLRLQVHDHDKTGGFVLHFDLNSDVFPTGQGNLLVQQFVQCFHELTQNPDQPVDRLCLLSYDEWQSRIIDFNKTDQLFTPDSTVISLFDEQAKKTPHAVALVMDDKHITYAELYKRANQLAHRLSGAGLSGILLDRSINTIVCILGVLKAGSAYVPLDPVTPVKRISYILKDAGVSILLTQKNLLQQLETIDCETLCLDSDSLCLANLPTHPVAVSLSPDDLAYVIYTSGSTGQPKGVMITHHGLANYIHWAKKYYLRGEPLDFPLYSSISFDLTVTSIFTPLVSGGRLVIYQNAPGNEGTELLSVIHDNAVDIIKVTPAHLRVLRDLPLNSTRIQQIIVGGDIFTTELANTIHRKFNAGIQLHNEYGPTESVVGCMIHQFNPHQDTSVAVPVGIPVSNCRIYLLDEKLNPVPTGVTGEICIAGNGVGRGYMNNPESTGKYFIDNPFSPGTRMYRSGDRARWTSDDRIDFIGRIDNQVKINGYRVELDEIGILLIKHPDIRNAVADVINPNRPVSLLKSQHCINCGLPSSYPDAAFDANGVCTTCREFEHHRTEVQSYFRTHADLLDILRQAKQSMTGKYDCLALLSGGKDSTYMLCKLVESGATPLVFSLDNGYISDTAKANIERVTKGLGLDHVWGSTPDMNRIFRDSLKRFSNVCNGCFKTLYTLSINLAHDMDIRFIMTGLSRGQLFETRLSDTFAAGIFDATEIDHLVMNARKAYHRMQDAVTDCLDTTLFESDSIFNEIQFVDFYRYTDVHFDDMYTYLTSKTPWVRPADTGRSTNCLINDLGIYVHKKEQGFHNYALPYSWDVRIGHKSRTEAMHELDDDIDVVNVRRILNEIGYDAPSEFENNRLLNVYYVSDKTLEKTELENYMSNLLPAYMIPKQFISVDEIPLTVNGKADRKALGELAINHSGTCTAFVAPNTPKTTLLSEIWASAMHLDQVGIHDNFFDLGGDSITSIQIIAKARQRGLEIYPKDIFEHQTIAELAKITTTTMTFYAEQGRIEGLVSLSPLQQHFLEQNHHHPEHWNQALLMEFTNAIEAEHLEKAIRHLLIHHDALRLRFTRNDSGWTQVNPSEAPPFHLLQFGSQESAGTVMETVNSGMNLERGMLLQAACFHDTSRNTDCLFMAIHHLVVDAISWRIILEDLETAYKQSIRGEPFSLPLKSTAFKTWAASNTPIDSSADGVTFLPTDLENRKQVKRGDAETMTGKLDKADTDRLLQVARGQVDAYLLTALELSLTGILEIPTVSIDIESHGRDSDHDETDLSRTVGCFTRLIPVEYDLPGDSELADILDTVRIQLETVKRYRRLPVVVPKIVFNYLGQLDHLLNDSRWVTVTQPLHLSIHPGNNVNHLFEVNSWVLSGELRIEWTYYPDHHHRTTVSSLINELTSNLRNLMSSCPDSQTSTNTGAADFPLADLDADSYNQLADVLKQLDGQELE